MTKPVLRIGLIGSGFMGMTHVFGFATAERVFDLPFDLDLDLIADAGPSLAEAARARFGFRRATGDWRELASDPGIGLVDIAAPNALHKDMALAAIAARKHVYCEKPLASCSGDAARMTAAVEDAGLRSQVGFNYLCNPMIVLARDMISSGELGDIRSYRGVHAEDYMADADDPWMWRHDPAGGGALADLGSHALATAEYLLGPIHQVLGDRATAIVDRADGRGGRRRVEVDDIGRAFLRFANGASGSIEANWLATGRKMQHAFEVYGSKGALDFSQERLNELRFYDVGDRERRRGFRTICAGPDHDPYGLFCVAPGHQLGFNDLKAIEIRGFLEAIAGLRPEPFNFRAGLRIQRLVEAVHESAGEGAWRSTAER